MYFIYQLICMTPTVDVRMANMFGLNFPPPPQLTLQAIVSAPLPKPKTGAGGVTLTKGCFKVDYGNICVSLLR